MASEIEATYGLSSTLVKGRGGILEVTVGGEIAFTNNSSGVLPEPAEVVAAVGKHVAV